MKNALKDKLQSNRGVTILMSLLFLFFVVMVCAVMLSAAVTGMETIQDERGQQQAYLTVSSAARLLQEELEQASYTVTTKKTYRIEENGALTLESSVSSRSTEGDFLGAYWEDMVKRNDVTHSFQVEFPTEMGTVQGELTGQWDTRESRYKAQIRLSNEDGEYPCVLYLHMALSYSSNSTDGTISEGEEKRVETTNQVYSWGSIEINKEAAEWA